MSLSSDPFSASVIPFRIPEQVRAFAEDGLSKTRTNYARLRDVAENGNGVIETMLAGMSRGASDYFAKVLEIAAVNTNAGFDFIQQLAGATSVTEGLQLWTHHTRAQLETYAAQASELVELAQKISSDMLVLPLASAARKTPDA